MDSWRRILLQKEKIYRALDEVVESKRPQIEALKDSRFTLIIENPLPDSTFEEVKALALKETWTPKDEKVVESYIRSMELLLARIKSSKEN